MKKIIVKCKLQSHAIVVPNLYRTDIVECIAGYIETSCVTYIFVHTNKIVVVHPWEGKPNTSYACQYK